MTDKELRKLKRNELLEILYYLQKENENLKAENESMQTKLEAQAENNPSFSEEYIERIAALIAERLKNTPRDKERGE